MKTLALAHFDTEQHKVVADSYPGVRSRVRQKTYMLIAQFMDLDVPSPAK